jgi:hypothetical protein
MSRRFIWIAMRGAGRGTEKGPGEGALWFRKDVPPAKVPFTGPSVLQVSWLNVGRRGS